MRQLLSGYAPVTLAWGFLEVPLGSAVDFFLSWTRSVAGDVTGNAVSGQLEQLLASLDPLTHPPTKDLLVGTRSNWTAFFDNSTQGADAASPMSYAARELSCRALAVTCVPNTLDEIFGRTKGSYGAVQFELFGPSDTGFLNYERSIAATNDGGKWIFVASGREQPFEEPEKYKSKKVSDRFTPDMLERYAKALGIDLFEPQFYGPNGYVVAKNGIVPRARMTLDEVRGAARS